MRVLFACGRVLLVEQQGDALYVADGDGFTRRPSFELIEWRLEPRDRLVLIVEPHRELEQQYLPDAFFSAAFVHGRRGLGTLVRGAKRCGLVRGV